MSLIPSLKTAHLDDPAAKRKFNSIHFAEVAPRYDFATRVLSFGGDARWKRCLIAEIPEVAGNCIDLACGTGDICFLLAERCPDARIEGVDLTDAMLEIAARRNPFGDRIKFLSGDMNALSQADESIDVVTGSYALRNAPDLQKCLAEIYRVLKPGGSAVFLDFSKSPSTISQRLQYGLLRFWGGLWGVLLHGSSAVHGYIAESLRCYPSRPQLAELFKEAGFEKVSSRLFYGGMTELTVFIKPEVK